MKNLIVSYALAVIGLFGPAGIHRFYLGKPISGIFYLLTWGFLGIGTVIDLIRMPNMVEEENLKKLMYLNLAKNSVNPKFNLSTPEKDILKIAYKNDGVVTPQMVTLSSSMSLREAKKELELLKISQYCNKDIAEDGAELYYFHGLTAKAPLF
ncbi:TM2 domain-containing protein [Sulfobacillus acidophilus]|uniref:TM2 domain-containing protein n=1 Tax=Sulfobacillus acidophilus TaxID=53633 RepID=A0ABS3AW90_9FIRM|nr:TM2 domain-containing protein [Sulfobacillus acidophilus]